MERPTPLERAQQLAKSIVEVNDGDATVQQLHHALKFAGFDDSIRQATMWDLPTKFDITIGPGWTLKMPPKNPDGTYPIPQWKLDWLERKRQEREAEEAEAFETII